MRKNKNANIVEAFRDYISQKNIDEDTFRNVLEESLRNAIAKMFGSDHNFDIIANLDRGDLEIWRSRIVVPDGEVKNNMQEISLSDVQALGEEDIELGEEYVDPVEFASFGRRAIQNLKQFLSAKLLEIEKEALYGEFASRVGEVVRAEVYQVWKREVLLMDNEGNELILPRQNTIPKDRFKKSDVVTAIIDHVDYNNNNPRIYLSRTSNDFLIHLFEKEVPELQDGLITIRSVARMPGERAKVAVETYDERIDPVGAIVGVRGSRIQGVVNELRNESIDVLQYTSNAALFIQRALSPAKNMEVHVDEAQKRADVFMSHLEIRKAIGRGGFNIKLAMELTGYQIDIYRKEENAQDEEDLYLTEFADEIDDWVIDIFMGIGCDTAKSILKRTSEELARATDLEEDTIDHVVQVLMTEFDDEELKSPEYSHLPSRDTSYYNNGASSNIKDSDNSEAEQGLDKDSNESEVKELEVGE